MSTATVRVTDGLVELRGFGVKRLKAVMLLAQHDELDLHEWLGAAQLNFGKTNFVSGTIHPGAREISLDGIGI